MTTQSPVLQRSRNGCGRYSALGVQTTRFLYRISDYPMASAILSVVVFSFLGPVAALVLVATMLDHEFAHSFMMRRLGYSPGPVRLIPLVGAYVRAGRPMLRSADIALIYLAGPLAGILSAETAALVASQALGQALAHQVYVGAAVAIGLNLVNLMPFEPLDGGLISRVVPYPALLLFPAVLGIWLLYMHEATTPVGAIVLYTVIVISVRRVQKWRRYVEKLRSRMDQGDATALLEMQASFKVPLWVRVFVVCGYALTLVGGAALFNTLVHLTGWLV